MRQFQNYRVTGCRIFTLVAVAPVLNDHYQEYCLLKILNSEIFRHVCALDKTLDFGRFFNVVESMAETDILYNKLIENGVSFTKQGKITANMVYHQSSQVAPENISMSNSLNNPRQDLNSNSNQST